MFVAFVGLWALVPSASAGDLAIRWDEPHTYLIRADVSSVDLVPVNAALNQDAWMTEYSLALVTTCTPGPSLRNGSRWEVNCTLDDLSFGVVGVAGDKPGVLLENITEWDELLTEMGVMQLVIGRDGVLRSATLDGLKGDRPRERANRSWMREILYRAYAAFDLELPKHPADTWPQNRVDATHNFVVLTGTTGTLQGGHQLASNEGNRALIQSRLRGTLRRDSAQGAIDYLSEMTGQLLLDTEAGTLLERRYQFEAVPDASTTRNVQYVQDVSLRLLAPGEEPPKLPVNRVIESMRDAVPLSRFNTQ